MMKTFKYRLYPNKEQLQKLEWTLARCCELYNAMLQERRDCYTLAIKQNPRYFECERDHHSECEKHGHSYQWRKQATKEHAISLYDQQNQLFPMKQEREEYKEITAHVLNDVANRVDKAFKGFFRRVKNGQTPGYPRYHSHRRYDSFTFPDKGGWKIEKNRLALSKIGQIRIKIHRPIEGEVKTCTVKREGTHWYVCFACEVEQQPKLPYTDEAIGIDLGLLHFATLSTGDTIENPRHLRKAESKLKKAQEALARKKRGSNRRKKAVRRVVAHHRKVRNRRKDFLHKESRALVDTYETIVFEDLQTKNLVKRPKTKQDEDGKYLPNGASAKAGLNKSISDAGWAMFTQMVKYKAEWAGTNVIFVNPSKTSQRCSACEREGPHKDLSERTHTCVHCGVVLDRDHNAALNILQIGYPSREADLICP